MDKTICNVVYVDRSIKQDRLFRARPSNEESAVPNAPASPLVPWESETLQKNISLLSNVFGDVHLCGTGSACVEKLFTLQDTSIDLKPTIVLIDIPHNERIPPDDHSCPPSPHSAPPADTETPPSSPPADDVYGLHLLQRIVSEAHLRNLSRLVIAVSVIGTTDDAASSVSELSQSPCDLPSIKLSSPPPLQPDQHRPLKKRCLKLGAADVLFSPIHPQSISSLEVRAYWVHKNASRDQQALVDFRRGWKRSWVGIADNRPYAYLRENMVASLMRGICQMEDADALPVETVRIAVSASRKPAIAATIGQWHFSAHDLTDDELVEASALMFKHAFTMPELAEWRIPTDQLVSFLVACRAAYNSFVPYHNFRHVVDVLQATFNFLVNIGALPPYPLASSTASPEVPAKPKSPMASLLHPFEALTLLITAIGHDVGHPGVNNGFLIVLNTPLAQLYNDRSVLESFHCAAYSQILRRCWPSAFNDTKMRKLMISSILATDMGMHFDYMKRLGSIQNKLAISDTTDGWNGRMFEEQTELACALLIKCADISNVARHHGAAVQWMHILSDEFSRQAFMEDQLAITSSLVAQPKKDKISLFRAQLGFMNMFAIPLFQGVANIVPSMQYCVDELEVNKGLFEKAIAEEVAKLGTEPPHTLHGTLSPRSLSVAVPTPTVNDQVTTKESVDIAVPPFAISLTAAPAPSGDDPPLHANGDAAYGHAPYGNANGAALQFDTTTESASGPIHMSDSRPYAPTKQRISEANTDGGTSIPSGGGDWTSQATSTTTSKMPLSPSTQGTSIVSRDSCDIPSSDPMASIGTTIPAELRKAKDTYPSSQESREDGTSLSSAEYSNSTANGNSNDKSFHDGPKLKKKTSRFRMNAFKFFSRHLNASPPIPTSNTDAATSS